MTRYTMWVGGPEVEPSPYWWIMKKDIRTVCIVFRSRVSEEDRVDYNLGLEVSWLVNRRHHPGAATAFLPWEEP